MTRMISYPSRLKATAVSVSVALALAAGLLIPVALFAQEKKRETVVWSTQEKALIEQMQGLRQMSDEDGSKLLPFIRAQGIQYPILVDPGRKVYQLFQVEGIPKTFLYDREGNLAAEAIDMRTRNQFAAMLSQVGLQ
jgi:peroxiredoxin